MDKNQLKKYFSFFNRNKRVLLGLVLSLISVSLLDSLFINHSPEISLKNLTSLIAFIKKAPYRLEKYFSKNTNRIRLYFSSQKNFSFSHKSFPSPINFISRPKYHHLSPTPSLSPSIFHTSSPTQTNSSPIPTPQTHSLSQSKLGVFVLNTVSTKTKQVILNGGVRIIKVIDPHLNHSMMELVKKYKNNFPKGIAVLRFYDKTLERIYTLSDNPERSAEDFFYRVNQPGFQKLGNNLHYFDYIQTPNEFEVTPSWNGELNINWNGRFWEKLTSLNLQYGIKTCIGGIPVGNINPSDLQYIISNLRKIKNMGGAFCYHGYAFDYKKNIDEEINLSLRYRQFYQFFKNNAPDLYNLPLILSEGGVAEEGNPKNGYLNSGSIEAYKSWLKWYDSEIKKDPYVQGVTLFQIGNTTDWQTFNLEPIADWLTQYLRNQT